MRRAILTAWLCCLAVATWALPAERGDAQAHAPGGALAPSHAAAPNWAETTDTTATQSVPRAERPVFVIKTIVGLLLVVVLAYLGGHPRVLRWEDRLGISQVITTGFPFVLLGMIARSPSVGILSDSVLSELSPVLRIGLGWIGFTVGFRLDARSLEGLPHSTSRIVWLSTALPFACVLGTSAVTLIGFGLFGSVDLRDPVVVRDALTLGTAAAMTAHSVARSFPNHDGSGSLVARIVRLEELAGVIGLALIAAYFRPQGPGVSWQLPGTAWLLLTIGLGATIGIFVYTILQRATGPEFLVLALGSISFAAGAAGYLHLSAVVVASVAGVLLANFPGGYHVPLRDLLERLERPIYLLWLLVVGALWDVSDYRGWILMPVFMMARLAGKWLATSQSLFGGGLPLSPEERSALSISPVGALAIAIVINAQLLHPGGSISPIVSAVIGGAVLTEVFVQLEGRRRQRRSTDTRAGSPGPREAEP